MTIFDYLFAVIPMLVILIFVHELGHFAVAKWCGVRVLKFSLGFGPPIGFGNLRLRWERGGTEYVIAWFPIGGFVKMLGENLQVQGEEPLVADAAPDEYLSAKPTWQKLAITFAGPLMNLLLPVVGFMGVLAVGVPRPAAVIGMVETASPAEAAGLAPADRILTIDGDQVAWWRDIDEHVREAAGRTLALEVERGDEILALELAVTTRSAIDEFGSVSDRGFAGIGSRRLPTLLGIPTTGTAAAAAGLQSGDRVVTVAGESVEDWQALRRVYATASQAGGVVRFEVARVRGEEEAEVVVDVPARRALSALGVVPATILVRSVSADMPASRAGLAPGDLILSVDGRPVGSFASFQQTVRVSRGRPLEITYSRGGETTTVSMQPEKKAVQGLLGIEGMDEEVYLIGITHALATLPGVERLDRVRNPIVAIPRAVEMTVDTTVLFLRGLGKLVTGEVGTDKLAGPIGIAEIARKSLDLGWQAYLSTMILISINLGILNLLPIPILDGGQALIYIVEGVKRAPISLRTRELVQSVGLTFLIMLMGLAFWNDLSRHFSRLLDWLSS